MSNKPLTTFDIEMQNPSFRKKQEETYQKFILSELVIALMTNNHKSVRVLAKECGISTGVINKLRTGKQADVKLTNFINISEACGYHVVLEKGDERIHVSQKLEASEPPQKRAPLAQKRTVVNKQKAQQSSNRAG